MFDDKWLDREDNGRLMEVRAAACWAHQRT